jgi:hypothetical protein
MVRQKGTLMNFVGDSEISRKDVMLLIQTGKIALGKERTQLIERSQLVKWGLLES